MVAETISSMIETFVFFALLSLPRYWQYDQRVINLMMEIGWAYDFNVKRNKMFMIVVWELCLFLPKSYDE